MERRRVIGLTLAALVASASPALAQSGADSIVRQLRSQGYSRIEVRRTLLGRVRIIANSRDTQREIVFNPSTGAILRDYWTETRSPDNDDRDESILGSNDSGSGSGSSGSGSGNSGSGPGNSGSGPGNSGRGSGNSDSGANDGDDDRDDDRGDDRGEDRDDDRGEDRDDDRGDDNGRDNSGRDKDD